MACKYYYNGNLYTEAEFKSILENGLIDQLVKDGVVKFEKDFTIDENLIKGSKEEIKVPVELKIRKKIQRGKNLNFAKKSQQAYNEETQQVETVNKPVLTNPLKVIKNSQKDFKGKYNQNLNLIIATPDKLYAGKQGDVIAKEILEDLSNAGYSKLADIPKLGLYDTEQEGFVYMVVDSASGAFPVRLFTNKIKDTTEKDKVKADIKLLSKTTDEALANKNEAIKEINSRLWGIDINFQDGKYIINSKIGKPGSENTKTLSYEFEKSEQGKYIYNNKGIDPTKDPRYQDQVTKGVLNRIPKPNQTIEDFILNTIYRVNINLLNNKGYNNYMADIKAIETDLYSDQGNFFHSSSFMLDYNIINPKADLNISKALEAPVKTEEITLGQKVGEETFTEKNEKNPNEDFSKKGLEANGIFDLDVPASITDSQDLEEFVKETEEKFEENENSLDDLDDFGTNDAEDFNSTDIREKRLDPENLKLIETGEEIPKLQKILGDSYKWSEENRSSSKKKRGTIIQFKDFDTLKYYLPKETYNMLVEASKSGKELFGLFTSAAILIKQNAPAGVSFHEAFHAVFNLGLPLETRVKILNEAYDRYPELQELVLETGEGLTWLQLEEFLADKYTDYSLSDGRLDLKEEKNTTQISKFFKGLHRMLNVFYKKNRALNSDVLFDNMNAGVYANKIQFKNTVLDTSVREMSATSSRSTTPQRSFNSALETKFAIETLNSMFVDQINIYRKNNNISDTVSDTEVIKEISVPRLLNSVLTEVVKTYNTHKTKNRTDLATSWSKLINVLTNDLKNVRKENGKIVKTSEGLLEFSNSSPLLEQFLGDLKLRSNINIDINFDVSSLEEISADIKEQLDGEILNEENSLSEFIEETATSDAVAMKNSIEVNPRETMSQVLKRTLSRIPKFLKTKKGGTKTYKNIYNVPVYENGNEIFKYLSKELANSISGKETMIEKLKNINKPYINYLLEQIEQNPSLGDDLWLAIGNKNFANFSFILQNKNGSFIKAGSNRHTLNSIILDRLVSDFVNPNNEILKTKLKEGQSFEETINNRAAQDFFRQISITLKALTQLKNQIQPLQQGQDVQWEAEFNRIQNTVDPKALLDQEILNAGREGRSPDLSLMLNFELLSNKLEEFNISISPEELNNVYNPNRTNVKISIQSLEDLLNSLKSIAGTLSGAFIKEGKLSFKNTGTNPFLLKNSDDVKQIKNLAKILEPGITAESILSFKNMDSKTVYSLIYASEINKMMEQIKDPDSFRNIKLAASKDAFFQALPFVKELADPQSTLSQEVSLTILDGLKQEGKNKGVEYSKMTDQELTATQLAMFVNNSPGVKEFPIMGKYSFYKLGIPADAPNIQFIKAPRLTRETIINNLVETAKGEHQRILQVKKLIQEGSDHPLLKVVNVIQNGTKWQTLSFLNNPKYEINTNKGFNEKKVREAIEEYLTENIFEEGGFFNKEIQEFKKKGVIKTISDTGELTFAENILDEKINKNENISNLDFLKSYLLNQYYISTQTNVLFAGDSMFYKNAVDMQKRYKQLFSNGTYTLKQGTLNAVILQDIEEMSSDSVLETINSLVDSSNLTAKEKQITKAIWKQKNNLTDAATLISLERSKEILEGLNRWTPEHQKAFDRIKEGQDTLEDFYLINKEIATPSKPHYYSVVNLDGYRVPLQIKNAEFVLTPAFALQQIDNKYKYPKLASLYLDLNGGKDIQTGETIEPKFDSAIFESAVKVGAVANKWKVDAKTGKIKYIFASYIPNLKGSYEIQNFDILEVDKSSYKNQQETPPHFIDDRSNFGTQTRNIIIADLDPTGNYDVGEGQLKNGKQTAKLFQELVRADLKEAYDSIVEDFLTSDGELNYDTLLPILRKQAKERNYGNSYLEAIEPTKDSLGNTKSKLPLYHPKIAYQTQALVNSIIKNRVTKQKIKGGQLVNFTSYGVSEKLDMKIDKETGAITLQAIMPWTSKKYFPTDEKGNVDISKLKATKDGRDLLQIIANRIPTEDKYSIFNIEIVDFNNSMGGQIILPKEITKIAGLDFDIDKVFFMMKSFYTNKKGEVKTIKYLDADSLTAEKKDRFLNNLFANHNSLKRFLKESNLEDSDIQKILNAREQIIDAESKNKLSKTDLFESKEHKEIYDKIQVKKLLRDNAKSKEDIDKYNNEITDLYNTLQNDFLPYNEALEGIQEQKEKVLGYLERRLLDPQLDINAINSKQARDNKKIDIMKGILKNKYTAPMILQTGNFDTMKEGAARVRLLQAGKIQEAKLKGKKLIEAAEKLDEDSDFNINLPSTQLELFRRNMDGRDLTGIFANHGSHHAKAQHTDLKLIEPIKINKKQYQALNKSIVDGQRVSRTLAVKNAAVVDNAKDPLAGFLNINYFTANSVALSDRLGVDERFTYALINQPYILKLTREYFNDTGSFTTSKHFDKIKSELQNKINLATVNTQGFSTPELTTQLLEEHLKESDSKNAKYLMTQLAAVELFEQLYNIGEELSTGVQAGRVDTQPLNPSNSENYVLIQKQNRVLNKYKPQISGLETIFMPSGTDQIMIPAFNEFGILKPISEILEKIFPAVGTYNASSKKFNLSFLGQLKQDIGNSLKTNGLLNEKTARLIDTQFLNFIATSHPFFSYSQNESIILETPKKLKKVRDQLKDPNSALSKELNNNSLGVNMSQNILNFLNELQIVNKDRTVPLDKRIVYYRTGKDALDLETSQKIWEEMLNSSNNEIKELGLDLVKYSFFTNGIGFGPYSFANIIPVDFWSDRYQETLPSEVSFNTHMEKIFRSMSTKSESDLNSKLFTEQFIQNFGLKIPGLVQNVQVTQLMENDYIKFNLDKNASPQELLDAFKSGKIVDTNGNILANDTDLMNRETEEFLGYIKRYNKISGETILYKHADTFTYFDGRDRSIAIYKPVKSLGISNFVLEFDQNSSIKKSWLDKSTSKEKPVLGSSEKAIKHIIENTKGTEGEIDSDGIYYQKGRGAFYQQRAKNIFFDEVYQKSLTDSDVSRINEKLRSISREIGDVDWNLRIGKNGNYYIAGYKNRPVTMDDYYSPNAGNLFRQITSKESEQQNKKLDRLLYAWARKHGIKVDTIENLKKKFPNRFADNAQGITDFMNGLIGLADNRRIDTMAEEVAHFAVEFLYENATTEAQKKGNIVLPITMAANVAKAMSEVHNTQTYAEVKEEYKDVYDNDIDFRKEALAKILAAEIVSQFRTSENLAKKQSQYSSFWKTFLSAIDDFLQWLNSVLGINTAGRNDVEVSIMPLAKSILNLDYLNADSAQYATLGDLIRSKYYFDNKRITEFLPDKEEDTALFYQLIKEKTSYKKDYKENIEKIQKDKEQFLNNAKDQLASRLIKFRDVKASDVAIKGLKDQIKSLSNKIEKEQFNVGVIEFAKSTLAELTVINDQLRLGLDPSEDFEFTPKGIEVANETVGMYKTLFDDIKSISFDKETFSENERKEVDELISGVRDLIGSAISRGGEISKLHTELMKHNANIDYKGDLIDPDFDSTEETIKKTSGDTSAYRVQFGLWKNAKNYEVRLAHKLIVDGVSSTKRYADNVAQELFKSQDLLLKSTNPITGKKYVQTDLVEKDSKGNLTSNYIRKYRMNDYYSEMEKTRLKIAEELDLKNENGEIDLSLLNLDLLSDSQLEFYSKEMAKFHKEHSTRVKEEIKSERINKETGKLETFVKMKKGATTKFVAEKDVAAQKQKGFLVMTFQKRVPKNSYLNEDFARLMQDPVFKNHYDATITQRKTDLKKLGPKYQKEWLLYQLPGALASLLDKLTGVKGDGTSILTRIKNLANESLFIDADDVEFGELNRFNTQVVPIHFTNKISPDKISFDLGRTSVLFAEMAENFNQMTEIGPKLNNLLTTISNREYIKEGKAPVKGIESGDYAAIKELLEQYVYGKKISDKDYQHTFEEDGLITKGVKKITRGKVDLTGKTFSLNKVARRIQKYMRNNNLKFNFITAAVGYLTGSGDSLINDQLGIYTTNESKMWARKEVLKQIPNALVESGKLVQNNKLHLILRQNQIVQLEKTIGDTGRNPMTRRLVNNDAGYLAYSLTDYHLKGDATLAIYDNYRLYKGNFITREGFYRAKAKERGVPYGQQNRKKDKAFQKEVHGEWAELREKNLYYAHETVDGQLKVKEEFKSAVTEKLLNAVRGKVEYVTHLIDGTLSETDRGKLARTWYGGFFGQHRGFLFNLIDKKFKSKQVNALTEEEEMGDFRAAGIYATKIVGKGLAGIRFWQVYNELSPVERRGVKRTVLDLVYLNFAALMAGMLNRLADEDDEEDSLLQYAAYITNRWSLETGVAYNPSELIQIIDEPVPGTRTIKELWSVWGTAYDNDVIEKGPYEGFTQRERLGVRLAPAGFRNLYEFQFPQEKNKGIKTLRGSGIWYNTDKEKFDLSQYMLRYFIPNYWTTSGKTARDNYDVSMDNVYGVNQYSKEYNPDY